MLGSIGSVGGGVGVARIVGGFVGGFVTESMVLDVGLGLALARPGWRTQVDVGITALAHVPADRFEEGNGNQAPAAGDEGIASFVPIGGVLPAYYVEEVTFGKRQLIDRTRGRFVIVESFNYLEKGSVSKRGLARYITARMSFG